MLAAKRARIDHHRQTRVLLRLHLVPPCRDLQLAVWSDRANIVRSGTCDAHPEAHRSFDAADGQPIAKLPATHVQPCSSLQTQDGGMPSPGNVEVNRPVENWVVIATPFVTNGGMQSASGLSKLKCKRHGVDRNVLRCRPQKSMHGSSASKKEREDGGAKTATCGKARIC